MDRRDQIKSVKVQATVYSIRKTNKIVDEQEVGKWTLREGWLYMGSRQEEGS
jgi:hypothetical protein